MALKDMFRKILHKPANAPDEQEMYPHLFNRPVNPKATVGSMVLYLIMTTTIFITLIWYITGFHNPHPYLYPTFVFVWMLALLPAFRMFQRYKEHRSKIKLNSLCSTCVNYEEAGLLCKLYDEHVSGHYTPCEGNDWQARSPLNNDAEE